MCHSLFWQSPIRKDSNTGVFLCIFLSFKNTLFTERLGDCFWNTLQVTFELKLICITYLKFDQVCDKPILFMLATYSFAGRVPTRYFYTLYITDTEKVADDSAYY